MKRPSDELILEAYGLVAGRLNGAPGAIFQALELLYQTAIETESTRFVAGKIRRIGDPVEWNHGLGVRRGKISAFSETKVEVRFPRGTYCGIEHWLIRDDERARRAT